jgi:hypothetical protein
MYGSTFIYTAVRITASPCPGTHIPGGTEVTDRVTTPGTTVTSCVGSITIILTQGLLAPGSTGSFTGNFTAGCLGTY